MQRGLFSFESLVFLKFNLFFFQIITFKKAEGVEEEEFDTDSHNMLINFMSNCKDFYKIE